MNYYEELGLAAAASPEKIRQAYKNLARLLHPDQQKEEPMRCLAELQMKRLNAIYAVLSDPVQRRAYDLSLKRGGEIPVVPAVQASGWRRLLRPTSSDARFAVWLMGTTLLASGLYWIFTADAKPRSQASAPALAPQAIPPPADAAQAPRGESGNLLLRELEHLRRRVQEVEAERNAARTQLTEWRAKSDLSARWGSPAAPRADKPVSLVPEPPALSTPAPALEVPIQPRTTSPGTPPAPQVAGPRSSVSGFAGTWFYTPSRLAPSFKDLYPPEYIETIIVEEEGLLRGRYYGRYRVTDRAISPEVIFQFEGQTQSEVAVLEWRGGGGARGEIRLKLLSENSLEVSWSATELGSPPRLAAGTAVLVRRVE